MWGGTAGGGVWRRLPGEAEPDWREEIGLYRESGKALFRCEHREAWAGSEPQRAGREKGGWTSTTPARVLQAFSPWAPLTRRAQARSVLSPARSTQLAAARPLSTMAKAAAPRDGADAGAGLGRGRAHPRAPGRGQQATMGSFRVAAGVLSSVVSGTSQGSPGLH